MQSTGLIYVELKSGYADNGPAWIGKGFYSKSGKTIYFNGQAFKKFGKVGNYYDWETKDDYWISGVKKKDSNRHWAGSGKITIDEAVVEEFLELRGKSALSKQWYIVEKLNNEPDIEKFNEERNLSYRETEGD